MRVALLAGGTGGAKLGAGMQEELGSELTVIANTGDDIEAARRPRLPRPRPGHLLAQRRNRRGARLGDPRGHLHRLRAPAASSARPSWFGLSDRDLAACLYRRQFLDDGGRPTDAQAQIARGLGVEARVLPMSDAPVRTKVRTAAGRRGLQEYLIVDRGEPDGRGRRARRDRARPRPTPRGPRRAAAAPRRS